MRTMAWAAFSLRRGIAPTSIRFLKMETEHWITKELQGGVTDWQLVEIEIWLSGEGIKMDLLNMDQSQ